jgi:ABC-2 type transport system permease protein
VHLIGMGVYAVLYGLLRAAAVFAAVVVFIGIHIPNANYGAAVALLAIASVSFIGIGMMTAVLPLVSPEKGTQLGFVAQGLMLVVSGVYYPVSVLPEWMQWIAKISPATYALRGNREQILHGAGLAWADVWPLLVIGAFSIPIGLAVFLSLLLPWLAQQKVLAAIGESPARVIRLADDARSLDPFAIEPLFQAADAQLALGNARRAWGLYLQAAEVQPDNKETWVRLGQFELAAPPDGLGCPRLALPHLQRFVELDPQGPGGQLYRDALDAVDSGIPRC